jgi:hypothetical protein
MTAIVLILVAVAMVFAYLKHQQNYKQVQDQYGHLTAGGVAQRLGLTLQSGDPNLNLLLAFAQHAQTKDVKDGGFFATTSQKETRIEMSGRPDGRDVIFVYGQTTEKSSDLSETKIKRTLEFHLTTSVNAPFDEFEIILRKAIAPGFEVKGVLAYPEQKFGDPELDQRLILRSPNPKLGASLKEIVRPLAKQSFLHLVGQHGQISYLSSFNTSSYAVVYIEEVAAAERKLAQHFEAASGAYAPASAY